MRTGSPRPQQAELLAQGGSVEVARRLGASPDGYHQRHAAGSGDGNGIALRRQLDADPAWGLRVRGGRAFELLQATGERLAVRMVLLTEGLQAQAAARVLTHETASFGMTAALARSIDSFAPQASSSAFDPRFVKHAPGLTLTNER